MLYFIEWDEAKRLATLSKHGVDFRYAAKVFTRPHVAIRSDRRGKERFLAIGQVGGKFLAVAYTERGAKLRIITARRARKGEVNAFRQGIPVGRPRA